MTTYGITNKYKSFEAAKIDNPESEIYWYLDGRLVEVFTTSKYRAGSENTLANPKKHCMTFKEFLGAGHKFSMGDIYLSINGLVCYCGGDFPPSVLNHPNGYDNERFILRAAALEKPKRVKVEYVPCLFADAWEPVKAYCDGEDLYCGAKKKVSDPEIALKLWIHGSLYRRIETEITERDVFIEKVEAIAEDITSDSEWSFACIATAMFDSGEFKLTKGE